MFIPNFTCTAESLIYGLSYYRDDKMLSELKRKLYLKKLLAIALFEKKEDEQKCLDISFEVQFLNESISALCGEIQTQYLEHLPHEVKHQISIGELVW